MVVTFNYRVNVFGWMAHPELTKESPNHNSGNYGALDQIAVVQWVQRNIGAFGGDPAKVMIFGQSGGSRSVNWVQASPLATGLFRAAAGESHAVFGAMTSLAQAEEQGTKFAEGIGKPSLAALRAMTADDLEDASIKNPSGMTGAIVDGWMLPQDVTAIFAAGRQNDVALLTGATNDETGNIRGPGGARRRGAAPTTVAGHLEWVKTTLGPKADAFLEDVQRILPRRGVLLIMFVTASVLLLRPVPLPAQSSPSGTSGTILAKTPVFAGACKACPLGIVAKVTAEALSF